jgi:cytochrome c5
MNSASKLLGLLLAILFLGAHAEAATVAGTVKGPDGTPFRGAFVQAQNTATRVLVSVLTDPDGYYRIDNLTEGNYKVQVRAVGYRADAKSGVQLAANQNASCDFALQSGMVRWSDLSQYQGEVLFPEAKGKDLLVGRCFACHGFQSRMAAARRDEDGWKDRVAYMADSMHFFLGGRRLVPEFLVRRGIRAAEISRGPAEIQGHRALLWR